MLHLFVERIDHARQIDVVTICHATSKIRQHFSETFGFRRQQEPPQFFSQVVQLAVHHSPCLLIHLSPPSTPFRRSAPTVTTRSPESVNGHCSRNRGAQTAGIWAVPRHPRCKRSLEIDSLQFWAFQQSILISDHVDHCLGIGGIVPKAFLRRLSHSKSVEHGNGVRQSQPLILHHAVDDTDLICRRAILQHADDRWGSAACPTTHERHHCRPSDPLLLVLEMLHKNTKRSQSSGVSQSRAAEDGVDRSLSHSLHQCPRRHPGQGGKDRMDRVHHVTRMQV